MDVVLKTRNRNTSTARTTRTTIIVYEQEHDEDQDYDESFTITRTTRTKTSDEASGSVAWGAVRQAGGAVHDAASTLTPPRGTNLGSSRLFAPLTAVWNGWTPQRERWKTSR